MLCAVQGSRWCLGDPLGRVRCRPSLPLIVRVVYYTASVSGAWVVSIVVSIGAELYVVSRPAWEECVCGRRNSCETAAKQLRRKETGGAICLALSLCNDLVVVVVVVVLRVGAWGSGDDELLMPGSSEAAMGGPPAAPPYAAAHPPHCAVKPAVLASGVVITSTVWISRR